jgi:hypothetical protein
MDTGVSLYFYNCEEPDKKIIVNLSPTEEKNSPITTKYTP